MMLDNGEPCWNTTSMANLDAETGEPLKSGHVNEPRPAGNGEPEWQAILGCKPRPDTLQRNVFYKGPAIVFEHDEASALLLELLDYFDIRKLPPPPLTSPRYRYQGPDKSELLKLLDIGVSYLRTILRGEAAGAHSNLKSLSDALVQREMKARENRDPMEIVREWTAFKREGPPQKVYFIQSESGPIKIGIAVNPTNRLKSLQTGHHERLSIVATCDGGSALEGDLHKRFKAHRRVGEWFEPHPDILAEIDRINSATTHAERIPAR